MKKQGNVSTSEKSTNVLWQPSQWTVRGQKELRTEFNSCAGWYRKQTLYTQCGYRFLSKCLWAREDLPLCKQRGNIKVLSGVWLKCSSLLTRRVTFTSARTRAHPLQSQSVDVFLPAWQTATLQIPKNVKLNPEHILAFGLISCYILTDLLEEGKMFNINSLMLCE